MHLILHLILLKIQNMMDINEDLHQWFINFLINRLEVERLKMIIFQMFQCFTQTNY